MQIMRYLSIHLVIIATVPTTLCAHAPLIRSITRTDNKVTYKAADDLHKEYLHESFFVVYPPDVPLATIPESILTIPFIMSIIPIVWISNNRYTINVMDADLYYALERIHKVFKIFYPSTAWDGQLIPDRLIKHQASATPQQTLAVLFSHGLDAVYTSLRHHDEHQLLITIWGSDVRPTQSTLWNKVHQTCRNYAIQHGYDHTWIQSNFMIFMQQKPLVAKCPDITAWWGPTSQDLGYCGLTAPLLYHAGINHLAMAATNTSSTPYPYGSHPLIGNNLRFCGIEIAHDHPATRTEKIKYIHTHCAQNQEPIPFLRVCWGQENAQNCLQCEKCWRTMLSLLLAGQEPHTYGFSCSYDHAATHAHTKIPQANSLSGVRLWLWQTLQNEAHAWLAHNASQSTSPMATLCSRMVSRDFQGVDRAYCPAYTALLYTLWNKSMAGSLTDEDLDDALACVQTMYHKV
jgi:hypothetical protein